MAVMQLAVFFGALSSVHSWERIGALLAALLRHRAPACNHMASRAQSLCKAAGVYTSPEIRRRLLRVRAAFFESAHAPVRPQHYTSCARRGRAPAVSQVRRAPMQMPVWRRLNERAKNGSRCDTGHSRPTSGGAECQCMRFAAGDHTVTLRQAEAAGFTARPASGKVDAWLQKINAALRTGYMPNGSMSKLAGGLCWDASALFWRMGRAALRRFPAHVARPLSRSTILLQAFIRARAWREWQA